MPALPEKISSASAAEWDLYWAKAAGTRKPGLYEAIAQVYRNQIISRSTARTLARYFEDAPDRVYLHAGCGSGGSDRRIRLLRPRFHFLDIAPGALALHRQQPLSLRRFHLGGDLFSLPYREGSLDGIFNLGVMEHFREPEIEKILAEFRRVLKPGGKVVLFWPPEFGLSVMALGMFLGVVNRFRKEPLKLHPDEVSRVRSFRWVRELMEKNRFQLCRLHFGWGDLFTHVVVVARKQPVQEDGRP